MGNEIENIVRASTWNNFVLKSEKPVLVDFWAEWCGPCKMVGPVLEQLSKNMDGKVKLAKLNVDENQEIAMKYGIKSIPSLVLFNEGQEIGRTVGAAPKETYQRFIERSLTST
jgi:thioredoxin 1